MNGQMHELQFSWILYVGIDSLVKMDYFVINCYVDGEYYDGLWMI